MRSHASTRPAGALRASVGIYGTELLLLAAVLILYGIFAAIRPSEFATVGNLDNMGRVGAILAVLAIGQAFALIVGGFDISVAVNAGFASVVLALMVIEHGGFASGIPVGLLAATVVGFVNGFLIAQLRINAFVVTLAMTLFLIGLGNQLSNGASVGGMPDAYKYLGAGDWGPVPSSIGIAVIVLVLAWLVLARSRLGLYLYSIGGSRDTVRLAGARVVRYEILAYTICGLCAGIAGMMHGSRTQVGQTEVALGQEVQAIAAAVMGGAVIGGGAGRLSGVVLGAALLTVLENGLFFSISDEYIKRSIPGIVLVVAVLASQWRGTGLRRAWSALRALGARRPPVALQKRGGA